MDAMEAIRTTFFQECDELLGDLEAGLLNLQAGTGDSETINAVFRAVHSVKGGAGAFGLDDLFPLGSQVILRARGPGHSWPASECERQNGQSSKCCAHSLSWRM